MKSTIVTVALLAAMPLCGCRTHYAQQPAVNLAPAETPMPEPIVIATPTPEAVATPTPPPAVMPVTPPPAAPAATPEPTPAPMATPEATPAPTPEPVATAEAAPTPRPDREAYLSQPYPRIQVTVRDESASDAGFKAWREQLDQAVAQRNLDALRKLIDADAIVSDPKAKPGITTFLEYWKLTYNARESEIWPALTEALRLGAKAAADKSQFTAPAIGLATAGAEGVLDKNIDAADRGVIVGTDVNARAEPSTGSPSLGKLSYEVVKIAAPVDAANVKTIGGETYPWRQIAMPDGKRAWVWGKYLRPWNDYRAVFQKTGDQWKITRFAKE